jgi:hypothetical protein
MPHMHNLLLRLYGPEDHQNGCLIVRGMRYLVLPEMLFLDFYHTMQAFK